MNQNHVSKTGASHQLRDYDLELHFTDLYREELPKAGPPTYKGTRIRYIYKITIATQRVGSIVQMLQVPIRVLPICLTDKEALAVLSDDTNDDVAPANPFLETEKKETYLELVLHYIQNLTCRRCPSYYVITNKHGKVGRFCLFKTNYRLGEDIVGSLDFSIQTVKCVQYSVTLQCEEVMLGVGGSAEGGEGSSTQDIKITDHNKYHEVSIGLVLTHIILPIPLYVTPSFKTDLVDVRWRLHFQFVTSTYPNFDIKCEPGETWMAPESIDIETMIWNLPIQLLPTNPLQIPEKSPDYTLEIKEE